MNELLAYVNWCTRAQPRPEFAPVRYYLTEVTDQTMVDPADNVMRVIANGAWRDALTWPPPGDAKRLLLEDLRGDKATVDVLADAAVPSQGGGKLTTPAGPFDQAMIDARPDVLLFTSQVMTDEVELIGSPTAKIWASSMTTDLDVIVRLEVLTSMGRAIALTDGVRRGRFVRGFDAVRPLTPGEPALFEVSLGPIALRLTSGQALRIAISGTSSPRYEPNPNVATPLAAHPATVETKLTVYRDAAHESDITLPVARGTFPGIRAIVEARPDAGVQAMDAGKQAAAADASLRLRDGAIAVPAPEHEADEGCACSTTTHPLRFDFGVFLLVLALIRRRQSAGRI